MDLTGEEAARIYLTPIARLKVFPPHLRALVELSVRTPIPIALNKDTSTLADILERLPEGVEIQYGYAIARAITNGEESGVPCLHTLDVPHLPPAFSTLQSSSAKTDASWHRISPLP